MELQIIAHPDLKDFSLEDMKDYLEKKDDLKNSGVVLEMKKPGDNKMTYADPFSTAVMVAIVGEGGKILIEVIKCIYDYIKTKAFKNKDGDKQGQTTNTPQENQAIIITLKNGKTIQIPPGTSAEDMANILKAVQDEPEKVERLLVVSAGD